jgi:hypothetical protein
MIFDKATKPASEDPPSIAELAERTRRSTPPPKRAEAEVRSLFVPIERGSLIPTHVDNDVAPARFALLSHPSRSNFVPYTASVVGLAVLSTLAAAGALVGRSRTTASPVSSEVQTMTPAQAASWAAAPFTVDVPLESPATQRATERAAPPAPPIDLEAAAKAVADAKASLFECDEVPATDSQVSITFSPAGRVTSIGGDSSELSECVKARLSSIRIAPFAGQPVTVRTTLTPSL